MPTFHLPPSPAYLVALSGGADSTLLLALAVRELRARYPEAPVGDRLAAAHLHHGIRGGEADRDEDFCRRLCESLEVPLTVERVNVPALAQATGESLETAARRARYDFFRRVMTEGAPSAPLTPILLTAHHADDNLETLLDRLLRGSGTKGMGGIPPTRELGCARDGSPLLVARPLLEWTKDDILEACQRLKLPFVTDSTNTELTYTRNRLRHTVVPALEEQVGRGIPQRAALRLSRAAREDEDCLSSLAAELTEGHLSPTGDGLELACLQSHHPALSKRMMAALYRRAIASIPHRDSEESLSALHLEGLWELAQKGVPESTLSLPHGMEARLRDGWLTVRRVSAPPPPVPPAPLAAGTTCWNGVVTLEVEVSPHPLRPACGEAVFASAVFPPDLPLPLMLRKREAGDVIRSHGMTKKLKKLLCDKNIPLHLRDILPLVYLPDGTPLWYPAVAFRDGYPAPREGACIRITVYCSPHS